MKRFTLLSFILAMACICFLGSCASSGKGGCGCPNKSGMVGYK